MAARTLSFRWRSSGTWRSWIILDMRRGYLLLWTCQRGVHRLDEERQRSQARARSSDSSLASDDAWEERRHGWTARGEGRVDHRWGERHWTGVRPAIREGGGEHLRRRHRSGGRHGNRAAGRRDGTEVAADS